MTDQVHCMYDSLGVCPQTTRLEFAPSNYRGSIISSKPSKNEISVDYIESILMDYGSYEHSIDRLVGELIMSEDEMRSAAQAIYDYVTKNI